MALTTGICMNNIQDTARWSARVYVYLFHNLYSALDDRTQSAKRRRLTVPSRDNNHRTTIGTKDMYDMYCMYVMHAAFFLGLASHFSEI